MLKSLIPVHLPMIPAGQTHVIDEEAEAQRCVQGPTADYWQCQDVNLGRFRSRAQLWGPASKARAREQLGG